MPTPCPVNIDEMDSLTPWDRARAVKVYQDWLKKERANDKVEATAKYKKIDQFKKYHSMTKEEKYERNHNNYVKYKESQQIAVKKYQQNNKEKIRAYQKEYNKKIRLLKK